MLGLLILNLLTLAFWLYNFEKFGDIYPTNLDNVILRNYPIMLNGIFVSTKTAFHVGHEYLIILA